MKNQKSCTTFYEDFKIEAINNFEIPEGLLYQGN